MAKIPNETNLPNTPGDNDHNDEYSGETDKHRQLPIVGQGSYIPDDLSKLHSTAVAAGTNKDFRKFFLSFLIAIAITFIALTALSIFVERDSQPLPPPTAPGLEHRLPLMVMAGFLVFCVVSLFKLSIKSLKEMEAVMLRDFEDNKGIFEPIAVSVDENGLVSRSLTKSSSYQWAA